MKTYTYYQPEYVSKFQCDGQKCNAYCCKHWNITIDKKTYKAYSHLKPKSAAKEIMINLKKRENADDYLVRLNEKGNCPFLTEDNWCSIQKKYGEEFLSVTCTTYPRQTWDMGEFYERSLTLTCPVVAEMVLLATEPLKFETLEVSEKVHSNLGKIMILTNPLPPNQHEGFIMLQETMIGILQERTLTIDQRLLMLGLFCDKLDESLSSSLELTFTKYIPFYKDTAFLQEQSSKIAPLVKFEPQNHIKIMMGILEKLYGEENKKSSPHDRRLLAAVVNTLKIETDENYFVNVSKLSDKYISLNEERQKFVQRFSTIFENYLVNELFFNLYPFRFSGTTIFNYGVFVTIYKMLELLTFSSSIEKSEPYDEKDLISEIRFYINRVDHGIGYVGKIAEYLEGKEDIVEIMSSMLQV